MHIFPDSRPDYFPNQISSESWRQELDQLSRIPEGAVLCLNEKGFTAAGKAYALWQKFKGFLGFNDETQELKISGRILKFLFIGRSQGYFEDDDAQIQSIQEKMNRGCFRVHQAVKSAFTNLKCEALRNQLETFYHTHQDSLGPSFWNRCFALKIDLVNEPAFGDTHLALAQFYEKEEPLKALSHYRLAAQLYNDKEEAFTHRLTEAFANFNESLPPNSEVGEVYLLLAQRHFSLNQFEPAVQFFQQAADNHAALNPAQKALWISALANTGQWQAAEHLSGQIPSHFQSSATCLQLAEVAFQAKRYAEAAKFFEQANQNGALLEPRQTAFWMIAAANQGDLQTAERLSAALLNFVPDAGLKEEIGRVYLLLAKTKAEAQEFKSAAEFFYLAFTNLGNLGEAHQLSWLVAVAKIGRLDVAEWLASSFSTEAAAETYLDLAKTQLQVGQPHQAVRFFEIAANSSRLEVASKALWILAAAKIGRLDRVQELSGELEGLSGPLRQEVGEMYLALAKLYERDADYEKIEYYSRLAFGYGIPFTQEQNFSWFTAASIVGKLDVVEKFAGQFSHPAQSQVAAAYLKLAETHFTQRQFSKAAKFFRLAAQQVNLSLVHKVLWFLAAEKLDRSDVEELLFPQVSHYLEGPLKEELQKAYLRLAEKSYRMGQWDQAVQRFEAAFRSEAILNLEQKALWMISFIKLQKFPQADLLSQQLFEFFPESPLRESLRAAYLSLAEYHMLQDQWAQAERLFAAATQNNAKLNAAQKTLRFVALIHLEKFEEAKAIAHEIVQNGLFDGAIGEAHLRLAEWEFEAGRYEEAALFFSRAAGLDSRQKALWMIAAAKTGQFDLAEELSETALPGSRLKEAAGETYLLLAERTHSNQQFQQAARFFQLASNEIPLSPPQKMRWMIAATMTQQHQLAEQLSQQVPDLQASDPARNLVGASYLVLAEKKAESDNLDGLERLFQLAYQNGAELTPRHFSLWLIAAAHEDQIHKAEWISHFLPDLIPDQDLKKKVAKVYLRIAEGNYEQGKFKEADGYFQLGLKNGGEFSDRNQILWLIASSKTGHFNTVERLAGNLPQIVPPDLKKQVGEACLTLAQRKWESRQIVESEAFFDLAVQNHAALSPHQKALWMIAAAKKEQFELVEKLSHELEAFHPSESLRGPLAKVMIRLATYLTSKKVEKAERSLFSFLWSEDPLNREEKKALACYQRALELAAADDRETLDLLVHFFVPFSARFANPNPEFGRMYLTLGERMYLFNEFADAEKFFLLAVKNKISLNSEQTALWMIAAAKVQDFATAARLSSQVAYSSLNDSLKGTVQEIYLFSADHCYKAQEFEQSELFYQLAFKTQAPLTLTQKAFWIISAARMGHPQIAEQFSKEDFDPLPPALKKEIGRVFLRQAEKENESENYPVAERFFQLAAQNRVPLNKSQQIHWFHAAIEIKKFETAEKLADEIGGCESDDPLRKMYLDAMIRLADHYAAPRGRSYLPSWGGDDATTLGRKAARFYYRVFLTLDENDPFRMQILPKIAKTAHCLKTDEPLMKLPYDSPHSLERIYSHLILVKHQDSLASPIHRKSVDVLTEEIWNLYKAGEGEQSLLLIEEALAGIGDIKTKYLYIQKAFFTRTHLDIKSNVPDLLDEAGAFAFNVGAKLHFLKGEILRKQEGNTQRVLASYELATNLAQKNPFGAGALFLVDDQSGGSREAHIETYRGLALKYLK